jgi:O-acetyl-ADP-ribose deacetylase (regulator of RNase III)
MKLHLHATTIELHQGDITTLQVDAIANAANSGLRGGGGVDGAIHHAGGPAILAECRQLYPEGCPTGQAVVTTAGNLPAKIVVHAVGPVWHGGDHGEPELLRSAYANSLRRAEERGMTSIAFPSISTGIYGYPIDLACPIAVGAALDHVRQGSILQRIVFCLFSSRDLTVYERHFQQLATAALDPMALDEPTDE